MMLATERLILREPVDADAATLRDYYVRNRERFAPWEPERSGDVEEHARWIGAVQRDAERAGHAASFLGFAGDALATVVELTGFTRDVLPGAMLSYSVDGAYEARGYASESVSRVIRYAFDELGVVQLSAYYHPENARSERLLQRLGFRIVARTPVVPGMEALLRPNVLATLTR